MALVHDIVEIDAGDTFAYDDAEGAATKEAREEAAADRLFGLLPAATGRRFRELWDEYERGDTRRGPVRDGRRSTGADDAEPRRGCIDMARARHHAIRVIARNGQHIEQSLAGRVELRAGTTRRGGRCRRRRPDVTEFIRS